jgi:hypothetical protein
MDRKQFFQSSFGAFFTALLPWGAAGAVAKPTKLPMTQWMGVPCAELPVAEAPTRTAGRLSVSEAALADAVSRIQQYDMVVADAFFNKWDLVDIEENWQGFDPEPYRQLRHAGLRGYFWGMRMFSTLVIPKGTVYILSDTYEPTETFTPEYPALLQKLVVKQ